jgi:rubrerythrin
MMISKEDFEDLLKIEIRARDYYNALLEEVADERVRKNIEEIRDDEIRHMELAERILQIISK